MGLFATLCGLVRVKGSGASKGGGVGLSSVRRPGRTFRPRVRTKCCVPVLLGAVVGLFAFTGAPALAAAPEAPLLEVTSRTVTEVGLRGVLNPAGTGEMGSSYEFLYNKSSTECEHGSHSTAGLSLGMQEEAVEQTLSGLEPGAQYTVCLLAENAAKTERTSSAPATFTLPAEAPDTSSPASTIASTSAVLEGTLNPGLTGRAGWYFAYNEGSSCQGAGETAHEGEVEGKAIAEQAEVTGLAPGKTYTFCLVATNEYGEAAFGNEVSFTTLAVSPKVASEAVSAVEGTAATLEAEVDPGGAATTVHFEYLTEAQFQSAGKTFTGAEATPESESIGADDANHAVPSARITGLQSGKTYRYRVVAENKVGTKIETAEGEDKTFTTNPATGTEPAENCPNKQLRAEQPFGLTLPDCRAYEMVSPENTEGQDATSANVETHPRASIETEEGKEAITYSSKGTYAGPTGATVENQYLSHRNSEKGRWETQSITPLHDPAKLSTTPSYAASVFTPELTAAVANTTATLTGEGTPGEFRLYSFDLNGGTYQYIAEERGLPEPLGSSKDLSHVVFGTAGDISEWVNGVVKPVNVSNTGIQLPADVGAVQKFAGEDDLWHAVSSNGSRVYFSTPSNTEALGTHQLYVRVNAEEEQSPLADGEAGGTGTLTKDARTVTSLLTAAGITTEVDIGATKIPIAATSYGEFVAGDPVSGSGIAPGTTITSISGNVVTLSVPLVGNMPEGALISSEGPEPFAVGQRITGNGIPAGTTIEAIARGELTLSKPAAFTGSGVELNAGAECAVSTGACTVEVSASQRQARKSCGDAAGALLGCERGWLEGVLHEHGGADRRRRTPALKTPNLYEYELSSEPGKTPGA